MIIGRLIPAGTGLPRYRAVEVESPSGKTREIMTARAAYEAGELLSVAVVESPVAAEAAAGAGKTEYDTEVAADGGIESEI
ncbi:MAG: hypothetical protein NTU88_14300 [Armatimonadetes bacterium]|nr:hypothetical protein [Armatimonadota bacterium]